MSDVLSSKKLCRHELELEMCIRCLREDNRRYESGRVVLTGEIEELKKKLSARLQQIDDLKQLAVRQGNEIRKLLAGERA